MKLVERRSKEEIEINQVRSERIVPCPLFYLFICPAAGFHSASHTAHKCTKIFSYLVALAIRHDRVITPQLRGYHARPFNHASFRALSKSDYRTMPRKFDSTAAAT